MKRWSISLGIFCSLIGSTNYWRVIAKTEMEANNHKVFVMKEWRTAFYLPDRIYNRSVTIGAERYILLQERGESSGLCGFCGFQMLTNECISLGDRNASG